MGTDRDLLTDVESLVRQWLDDAAGQPVAPAARRLADVLRDPAGLDFTVSFVDSCEMTVDTLAHFAVVCETGN